MNRKWILAAALAALAAALAPSAASTPAACGDECRIGGHTFYYLPPAQEVASGATVSWYTLDVGHVNADGSGAGENGSCLFAVFGISNDSDPVRLDATPDGLVATTDVGTPDEESALCTTATALPGGGYVLPYYCVLHPQMRAALVVTPAA